MAEIRQNPDGSLSVTREQDAQEMARIGGYAGAAGTNTGAFSQDMRMAFNIAGPSDAAGGLLQWQNTLGYDVAVSEGIFDILSPSGNACTGTFGVSSNSTGTVGNIIQTTNFAATACLTGTGTFIRCTANAFVVGSRTAGTSSGMVARFYMTLTPLLGAASK